MDVQKIVIGVVIVILIYLLYMYFFGDSSRTFLVGLHDATQELAVPASAITPGPTADFTYSIWVYVSNWDAGIPKVIFQRQGEGNTAASPLVAFSANMNNVDVTLATYSTTTGEPPQTATCTIENVPLQAWTNIIMTLNGNALDLYLDGKLVRTCILPGVPKMQTTGDLVLTPSGKSFQGYTSSFQYFARAMNPREAYAIYREGYGGSNWLSQMFNKYRIQLAFLKDNEVVNSFQI